ncbi:MAG: hypothetical protein FGM28_02790 [Limnohabitans sp.]|nr:hypothetical protein [Limnohabitans sp.]
MLERFQILVLAKSPAWRRAGSALGLCVLAACGQRGGLVLPNDPDFQQRATLPDIMRRQLPGNPDRPAAVPPASSPSGSASSAR